MGFVQKKEKRREKKIREEGEGVDINYPLAVDKNNR